MPTLNFVAELTVDDLLTVISKLDDKELAEFEIRFERLWLSRSSIIIDKEAAEIAAAHRLSPTKQAHLQVLLEQNREEGVTEAETKALDAYLAELDGALEATAADLLKLAARRQQEKAVKAP